MHRVRQAGRDGPKPRRLPAGRVRPQYAADVLLAVEHVVIVVRPLAARAGFRGAFQGEHGYYVIMSVGER